MYAIIATGGKQYKVSEGDVIKVYLSVCLSVTIFLVIAGLSLVLVYDHFAVLTLIHNLSGIMWNKISILGCEFQ